MGELVEERCLVVMAGNDGYSAGDPVAAGKTRIAEDLAGFLFVDLHFVLARIGDACELLEDRYRLPGQGYDAFCPGLIALDVGDRDCDVAGSSGDRPGKDSF